VRVTAGGNRWLPEMPALLCWRLCAQVLSLPGEPEKGGVMGSGTAGFEQERQKIIKQLSERSIMVLATSANGEVSARSMSVFVHHGRIYFQTGSTMEKMAQIRANRNVALCFDNWQIQGEAKSLGNWDANPDLLPFYIARHEGSYRLYGKMKEQIVVEVTIRHVKRWDYVDRKPHIASFDFVNKTFTIEEYLTV
jgi:hypothetical protein